MPKNREELTAAFQHYETNFEEEQKFIASFLELLRHARCFHRNHLPGHITGSAWIVDESRHYVLLTHHAKLNRWLQPGGHADGDENVARVALREAKEETGLKNFSIIHPGIFDIDIHTIPARHDFPEHLHYDVRFLFEANRSEKLIITEESHDLKWVHLNDIGQHTDNHSLVRMAKKLKN